MPDSICGSEMMGTKIECGAKALTASLVAAFAVAAPCEEPMMVPFKNSNEQKYCFMYWRICINII